MMEFDAQQPSISINSQTHAGIPEASFSDNSVWASVWQTDLDDIFHASDAEVLLARAKYSEADSDDS